MRWTKPPKTASYLEWRSTLRVSVTDPILLTTQAPRRKITPRCGTIRWPSLSRASSLPRGKSLQSAGCTDPVGRGANAGSVLDEELLRSKAYAVGDAKRWDRPLDVPPKESTDPFDNKNPSYQIFYMQHSGTEWDILTNGRL